MFDFIIVALESRPSLLSVRVIFFLSRQGQKNAQVPMNSPRLRDRKEGKQRNVYFTTKKRILILSLVTRLYLLPLSAQNYYYSSFLFCVFPDRRDVGLKYFIPFGYVITQNSAYRESFARLMAEGAH